jgi:DNA-binding protein H-NS
MNLSGLSVADLRALQDQVKHEIKRREHDEMAKAREQILAIAHSVGMPLKDLMGAPLRMKTGSVAVRYRHPANPSLEWTGRGRQPKWVVLWQQEHDNSLDGLRVAS